MGNKVKAPYNVNKLTSKVALDAYANLSVFNDNMAKVLAERVRLKAALSAMKDVVHEVKHSDTNFLMFKIDNAQKVYKQMADGGVVVRYRGNCLHCAGCLRVTIGTPEENDKFLK